MGPGIAVLAGLLLTGAAPPPVPAVSDLHPIILHPGINRVPGFLPNGGTATIIQAWRGNGNAHGYHVWMVLGGPSEDHPVGLIQVDGETSWPEHDTISDAPFDGERVLGTVRFATARMNGRPATLLVTASLDEAPSGILADHATATVRWYRLDHRADAIGRTTDAFEPIGVVRTTKRYCNAELSLRDVAGVSLPDDYADANRSDGCVSGG